MGNNHCVPQAPRRLRASFSRKLSLKGHREDSSRRLAGLLGPEAAPAGGSAADKILYYVPASDIRGRRRENLDQLLPSVSRGQQGVPVRDLGQAVHYAKVQLRFPHSQDTGDCYLELFPSHLYFQAHGSEGLTLQGLLPLTELSVSRLEGPSEEHTFQITGPLPAPLLVLCPSEAELGSWLYHLEKQMALVGGLRCCHSASPQHRLTRLRTVLGREAVDGAICASRVKLQHLPSQEQHERLLVLYPSSLAVFSEEPEGLCFKGELPLSAVTIKVEEKQKHLCSFLIEGCLINTIRVLCASWEDRGHWLRCLHSMSLRDGSPSLPSPEGFLVQAIPGCTSISQRRAELKRRGSSRSPRSKAWSEGPGPATPLYLDLNLTQLSLQEGLEDPDSSPETPHSPLYADPYTPPATAHHKLTDVRDLGEFLSAACGSPGLEPSGAFPSVPVSVPVSSRSAGPSSCPDAHLLPKKGASQRHRGFCKDGGPRPPNSPQLVSPAREGSPLPPPPGGCSPRRHKGPGCDGVGDQALPTPHQKGPWLGVPEAEACLTQWI